LRDRLFLAKELLHESGSIFVQISDENEHHVRELLDEVFGSENFVSQIIFQKTGGFSPKHISSIGDYILWYSKDLSKLKSRPLFVISQPNYDDPNYVWIELKDGSTRKMTPEERRREVTLPKNCKIFRHGPLLSDGKSNSPQEFEFEGEVYFPSTNSHWKTTIEGLEILKKKNLIIKSGNRLAHKLYWDYFPAERIDNIWKDTQSGGFNDPKVYVVQTTTKTIQRCLLMSTDPGDLALDITCGSGTTAVVSENWGRRWITCDTSRVAITLAKQRLMTANFDYFELAHPDEGVGSGFKFKTVPHVTLKSIANNVPPPQETLYDQPFIDNKRKRVTGPFTVEAVPAPVTRSFEDVENDNPVKADISVSRTGETFRQNEWKDELLRAGVRAKGGKLIEFTRVETLSGTKYLQAEAETKEDKPKRVVVCFGPEHAPLEQRMVEIAIDEARTLVPKPEIILFCAFQFDEEAAKDIDETNWPGVTLLKAQMNADLFTDDLKKKRSSNESFWLIGQPDVIAKPDKEGKFIVEVLGFDYYNPKTGTVESGGRGDIAMWMLDHDYDGRSLFPSQVFFPMAGAKEGWTTLAKNLNAEIDMNKIEAYGGTVSLPFATGKAIAVKIIDARGIESLKIIRI
jgi:adenine-specific DNA-methyltransferase